MLFPIALALALQGASQPPAAPDAVRAAGDAWTNCTRARVDAGIRSSRTPDALVNEAFAACAAEQEAIRAAIEARRGAELAASNMERVLSGGRAAYLEYIAEQRGGRAATAR